MCFAFEWWSGIYFERACLSCKAGGFLQIESEIIKLAADTFSSGFSFSVLRKTWLCHLAVVSCCCDFSQEKKWSSAMGGRDVHPYICCPAYVETIFVAQKAPRSQWSNMKEDHEIVDRHSIEAEFMLEEKNWQQQRLNGKEENRRCLPLLRICKKLFLHWGLHSASLPVRLIRHV